MRTIIYHAITTYHMLEFIVHNTYYKYEKSILIMPQSLVNFYPNYQYLEDNDLMTRVVVMPDIVNGKDENDIVNKIGIFVEKNLSELNDEDVEVHLAGGQYMFSAYLISKNIPFVFYEEAGGILSRIDKLKDNVKKGNPLMYEIATKNGMFDGSNSLVKYRVCNKGAQSKNFEFREDDENFEIVYMLEKLAEQEIKKIIKFYTEIDEYDIKEKSCLLLTQHFANLSILTYEQQVLLYQTFCDYFLDGYSIVFKPHPFDFIDYTSLFIDSIVLRERFPSELLPFMFKNRPEIVATVSSTAIFDLACVFDKSLQMDFKFEKEYYKMAKYFTSELIIEHLLENGYRINLVGINEAYYKVRYLENSNVFLYKSVDEFREFEMDQVYVLDEDLTEKDINKLYLKNINCIFLDIGEKKNFFRYQYRNKWNEMSVINISKSRIRDNNVYIDMRDENIYIVGEIRGEFEMDEEKVLSNSGIVLNINKYNYGDYEQMALKGILDATEKRLAYYIDKCETLENRIEKLKNNGYPIE